MGEPGTKLPSKNIEYSGHSGRGAVEYGITRLYQMLGGAQNDNYQSFDGS